MDTWKHGRYVDLWSIVHFLSGILIGTGLYWFGFPFLTALLFATLLMIAWELYEWLLGILEESPNVALDIGIGLLGFLIAAYVHYVLLIPVTVSHVALVGGITAVLSLWGFSDLIAKGFR